MPRTADLWSQDIDGESHPAAMISIPEDLDGSGESEEMTTSMPKDGPLIPEPNEDPFRRRIANRQHGLIPWIKRQFGIKAKRELSMAEIAEMSDAKRASMLEKVLKEEAIVCEQRLVNALDRMGFSYRRWSADGEIRKIQKVALWPIVSTEDAHWLHVDMDHLPYGVNSSSLIEQRVLDDLGKSVGHKVNLRSNDEAGIWYVVERASGMMGLPVHVAIQDMWQRFPPSSDGLTLPLGMTTNRRAVFEDLDSMIHMLVAGETGGGKSNAQNVILSTLAMRNSPQHLKLLLMDMKAGLEFQFYEGLPHLITIPDVTDTGIIEHPDFVYPAFAWLIKYEAARRMKTIRASKHRSIEDYNARRKEKMPRLLVMCDEWGIARLGDKGKEAEVELAKSVMLLRAVGIHIGIGTQTPTKEVLGLLVRSNMPTKICFNCNELSASTIVVGNSDAMGLPTGRAIYKRGMQSFPVQFPYISEEMVKSVVRNVQDGKSQVVPEQAGHVHDVSIDEMLQFSLAQLRGDLVYRELERHFSHRGITQNEIRTALKDLEGKTVQVHGKDYIVEPGSGSKARRLVAVVEDSTNE